jgi:hypothetical protein
MRQFMYITLLCLGLACSGMACAPKRVGPTVPGGYFFTLQVSQPVVWLGPEDTVMTALYPDTTELMVRVQNAQGQPVDGVPVVFEVEPAEAGLASISPPQAATQNGTARATLRALTTTGMVRVMARVDNAIQRTTIWIEKRRGPSPGASD